MNSEEDSSSEKLENDRKLPKLSLKTLGELKMLETDHILNYIDYLHNLLQKKGRRLKKQKSKIKQLERNIKSLMQTLKTDEWKACTTSNEMVTTNSRHNESNTETTAATNETNKNDHNDIEAKTAFGFVDEMRQVAEQAQALGHLVYEPTSGLYYDKNSGYYYNAEYGLYYDGNTGCYYSYNNNKKAYEFHSQVQVQSSASNKTNAVMDKNVEYYLQADVNATDEEVYFDEYGVVTDQGILKQLRAEKSFLNDKCYRKQKLQQSKTKKPEKSTYCNNNYENDNDGLATTTTAKESMHNRKKHRYYYSDSPTNEDKMDFESSKNDSQNDIEEGELPSSSSSCSSPLLSIKDSANSLNNNTADDRDEKDTNKIQGFKCRNRYQDIAKKYPPSLRIIVQETNLKNLKVGSLSLITYKGGSLGREGSHDVIIPDVNVSKDHVKFIYDIKRSLYKCIDLGSRNGTILNGQFLSGSKDEEHAYDLVHGSALQVGQTKLLCHVHEGNSTCGLCEPGLLIVSKREQTTNTESSNTLSHKEQLKKLQKKYGLENEKFMDNVGKQQTGNYNDRAARRRLKVGSSTDKEKTQMASVDKEISSDNKGFKMLSKLGWNKGETLGKTNATSGLLEPINVETNTGTRGLGCQNLEPQALLTNAEKLKLERMKRTQERYNNVDIFHSNEEGI